MRSFFNVLSVGGLIVGGLALTGIAAGPATTAVITNNFAAAADGGIWLAETASSGLDWITGTAPA